MANTQGGTIVLGVAEKSTGLVWEGVPDAAQLRTVLWGQLNDRHKVSANLLRDDDVRTVEDEGRQFVVVNVPRASRLQRPVFVGPNPMTGTYRRADEGDYRCSDDEVRRMLADQSDTPADSQIVEHFGQPDFDPETGQAVPQPLCLPRARPPVAAVGRCPAAHQAERLAP
jgi:ATP-dependent DNA helicase RecG